MTIEEKINFLHDEKNIHKCLNCPMNEGFSDGADHNTLPCGQYNCWVKICVEEQRQIEKFNG